MKLSIQHETRYVYDAPVRSSTQYLRMTPRDTKRQRVLDWKVETPLPSMSTHDGYGNVLHVLTLDRPVSEIRIAASGTVHTTRTVDEPSDFTGTPLSPLLFLRATSLTESDAAISAFAETFRRRSTTLAGLRELTSAIHGRLALLPPESHSGGDAAQAFAAGSGTCRDHAHVFIACCRQLGIPARYVSGYLCAGSDAGALVAPHAWSEAWVVNRWRSFDIAGDAPIGEAHIKVAVGADYLDACPIRGTRIGGGTETLVSSAHLVGGEQ